jgi:SAM-dependent methyltransferase
MERQLGRLEEIHKGHVRRYEFAANLVSGDVLDAACGCGYGSRMLMDAGCNVVGIDIDEKTIVYAKKNYSGPEYIVCNVCPDEKFSLGYFDWVVSFETIEHLPNPGKALRAFRECAENLIVSSPNSDHYPFRPESYAGDMYPHLRHYSPKELEDLLNSCGWEVVGRYGQAQKIKHVDEREGPFQVMVCE